MAYVKSGVLLYGPPAVGKSTTTRALVTLGDFTAYQPLKVGGTPRKEYRATSHEHLDQLSAAGELLWDARLYGARYAFDRAELDRLLLSETHPVINIGTPAVLDHIQQSTTATWHRVELWCDLDTATRRLTTRGDPDLPQRLERWHATPRLTKADLRIDTTHTHPHEAALAIRQLVIAELTSPLVPIRPFRCHTSKDTLSR